MRQDQERWSEAEDLASYALSVEPASGHAVHARAHVFYETGQHAEGSPGSTAGSGAGAQANHRSHFSWHAALHELMQCDVDAVRRRYERELAPPLVTGSRALVDSGALLWRCHVTGAWEGALPSEAVCAVSAGGLAAQPADRFAAMHSALGLATEGDDVGLAALRTIAHAHADPAFRDVVAPLCGALQQVVEGEFAGPPDGSRLLPRAGVLGGSVAQREVLEDTLVYALTRSGQEQPRGRGARRRLSRRPSPGLPCGPVGGAGPASRGLLTSSGEASPHNVME